MNDLRRPMFIAFHNAPPTSRCHPQQPHHRPVRRSIIYNHGKPPVKRRETDAHATHPEPVLLSLCRQGHWEEVLMRCKTHPQEAPPVGILDTGAKPWKRDRKSTPLLLRESPHQGVLSDVPILPPPPIYEHTALGLVCASAAIPSNLKLRLIYALLQASPEQLIASQKVVGCTPLRGLMIHSHGRYCEVSHLAALLEQDTVVVSLKDTSGLTPVDHLAMRLHLDPCQRNIDLFRCYVDMVESRLSSSKKNKQSPSSSPLIRLLSLVQSPGNNSNGKQDQTFHAILECTKYLLQTNPSRIHDTSKSSGCTILHVALRNFGDQLSLIQLLLEYADGCEEGRSMLCQRNVFGDLPLHVACAGGSPMAILKLILAKSVDAAVDAADEDDRPHPLLWSTNNAGYTPVDLEWMRHIEGGGGLYERRTFYPLEERGLRCESTRQEGMYQTLLRKAVSQVMSTSSSGNASITKNTGTPCCFFFGALLDRIVLIVQMAYCGGNKDIRQDKNLLHAASSLAGGSGPYLPQPMLFLFHWMHKEQTRMLDDKGRLPLHYSLMDTDKNKNDKRHSAKDMSLTSSETKENVWVKMLIDSYPEGARVADKTLRLPLHYALDSPSFSNQNGKVVDKLILHHPESLERRDPNTGLYPFQQAAANDLTTCFLLLRRAPNLVIASSLQNS